ncbi:MAG: hypothetical protein VB084_15375 [Syntrophomonadaceae bacterium]|nr:hypothetical protein [Syntrophomonadaceae bacterium]
MKNFINTVEKGLVRVVAVCLLLMVLVQGLMTADPIRFYLSWGERMEGQNIQFPVNTNPEAANPVQEIKSPQARVTIGIDKYSSLPRTKILVNGQEKYSLTDKRVVVDINAGDTLEIDSSAYNFPIDYQVTEVSSNVAFPEPGQTYTANQTIVMIGKIIVK